MGEPRLPKYEKIKQYIREKIESKELLPSDRLPSETELSERFQVSIITSRRALSDLCNEGIIYRIQGKGSFVSDRDRREERKGTKLVAIVLSLIKTYNDIYLDIIKGAQSQLDKYNYSMLFYYHESNPLKEQSIVKELLAKKIEGLILYSYDPEENFLLFQQMRQQRFPFVLIDRYINDLPTNYVVSDGFDGAYQAVEYLIGLGHDKIGFVSNETNLIPIQDRYEGYKKAIVNNQILLEDGRIFLHYHENKEQVLESLVNKKITAIFAANDFIAIDIMKEGQKRNLVSPRDFSIIGFDNTYSSNMQDVPLTTVQQPFFEIGKTAANILVKNIADPSLGSQGIRLPTKLICRSSCRSLT